MKGQVLFCISVIICLCSFGCKTDISNNISGSYYSPSGKKIEIIGNELFYIVPHVYTPFWYNDTLAKCYFNWVDPNYIEINSISPAIYGQQGIKVVQSIDSTINDSIRVSFLIPYSRSNLKIHVHTNNFKTFDFIYSKSRRELMIPNNVESISFDISPEQLSPHTCDGLFYGAVGFYSFQEYKIENNKNHISIEIPAIDGSFFERYFIKGDYARIKKGAINWKGETFQKIKQ